MSSMKSYSAAVVCPFCHAQHEAASDTKAVYDVTPRGKPRAPKDGDLSICIECGEWCIFQNDALVIPDEKTYEYIAGNPACQNVRRGWLMVRDKVNRMKGGN